MKHCHKREKSFNSHSKLFTNSNGRIFVGGIVFFSKNAARSIFLQPVFFPLLHPAEMIRADCESYRIPDMWGFVCGTWGYNRLLSFLDWSFLLTILWTHLYCLLSLHSVTTTPLTEKREKKRKAMPPGSSPPLFQINIHMTRENSRATPSSVTHAVDELRAQ